MEMRKSQQGPPRNGAHRNMGVTERSNVIRANPIGGRFG
jgi:hypothetical protein